MAEVTEVDPDIQSRQRERSRSSGSQNSLEATPLLSSISSTNSYVLVNAGQTSSASSLTTVKAPSRQCWVVIVCVTFELLLVVALALMFFKYDVFINAKCEVLNATNGSNNTWSKHNHSFYANKQEMKSGSYMHTLLIVFSTSLSLLTMLEFGTFGYGVYQWLKTSSTSSSSLPSQETSCKTLCKTSCCSWNGAICVVLVVAFIAVLLAAGMLFFAIKMEMDEERCEHENTYGRAVGIVYFTHAALDCLTALAHCAIRVWMIILTHKIKKIWSKDKNSIVQDPNVNNILATNTIEELADNAFFEEYEIGYKNRGKLAKNQMLPFMPWFMIPLLHFLLFSLINPHLLLTPWTYNHNGRRSIVFARARYFYFALILAKFVELLVQYGCVWRMNEYNKQYYDEMKENVLYKYGHFQESDNGDAVKELFKKCYIIAASKKKMEFIDDFDFEPSFLSFKPKIQVENPLYIVVLVIGLIVSSSDFLFK